MAHIAIVGAGMAGLSALQRLKEHGHQVTIFDKSRGSGGRLATKKVGDASWDMGAQFMRSHDEGFKQALLQWQQEGWIQHWDFQPHLINDEGIHESPDDVERYVGVSRMTALSRKLLACADQFHASTRIAQCRRSDQSWHLEDDMGNQFDGFDGLIINTPPLQAQPLLQDIAPELAAQCDVDLMPTFTLLLAFDQRLSNATANDIKGAFVKHPIIDWVSQNSSKPERDQNLTTWVVHADHDWTRTHSEAPRDGIQQQMLDAFFEVMQSDVITPTESWLHRWLYAIAEQPLHKGALVDEQQQLAVCGDWVDRGAVEGAWLSGQKAALQFINN
ncbi:hypothetical protein A3759_07210 [Thalassolituus sp. HI0120]|jgi:hypothetical protein|nr:hypothetical protein A3759_07210 [Thalassolituus sp. HI0120]